MDSMEMRRDAIVQLINENGTVSFAQIKKAFPNVSEMTLRTDLKILDEEKKILRVHGGAKSVQVIIGTDDFLNRKSVRNIPEKQEIAKKALALLHPDTTFFLDSGSTATVLARQIPDLYYGAELRYGAGEPLKAHSDAAGRQVKPLQSERIRLFRYQRAGAGEL